MTRTFPIGLAVAALVAVAAAQDPAPGGVRPRVPVVGVRRALADYRRTADLDVEIQERLAATEKGNRALEVERDILHARIQALGSGDQRLEGLNRQLTAKEPELDKRKKTSRLDLDRRMAQATLEVQGRISWRTVVAHDPALDITPRVIEALNRQK